MFSPITVFREIKVLNKPGNRSLSRGTCIRQVKGTLSSPHVTALL